MHAGEAVDCMAMTFRSVWDGNVLHSSEPLDPSPDTEAVITAEELDALDPNAYCYFRVSQSLNTKNPTDWSTRVDEILYSAPGFKPTHE